jgi:hypothetical protein
MVGDVAMRLGLNPRLDGQIVLRVLVQVAINGVIQAPVGDADDHSGSIGICVETVFAIGSAGTAALAHDLLFMPHSADVVALRAEKELHASTFPEVVVGPGGGQIIRVNLHFSQVEN